MDLHDDDGRRYGDWQKKDLRKDANEIQGSANLEPWYKQNFWMVVLVLVFWPVGLFLAWKSNWPIIAKIIATLFVIATVGGMMWINFGQGIA